MPKKLPKKIYRARNVAKKKPLSNVPRVAAHRYTASAKL